MSTSYLGHPSREHWNVSLWLLNDEGLYNLMKQYKNHVTPDTQVAEAFLIDLHDCGITHTPDGVRYTVENIAYVMADL